jgi:nucleoside 2-deoxyribosyltransferase
MTLRRSARGAQLPVLQAPRSGKCCPFSVVGIERRGRIIPEDDMNARKLRGYLAGPEVFLMDAIAIGQRKKALCSKYGFEGLYPFDNEVSADGLGTPIDILIYRANISLLRKADFGIFNLTPFRGPSADVGTVFELGVLTALEKPVFGYSNDYDDYLERLKQTEAIQLDAAANLWHDVNGMTVENFGNADNLMISATLVEQSNSIIRRKSKSKDRFRDLSGFEECLRLAAKTLSSSI